MLKITNLVVFSLTLCIVTILPTAQYAQDADRNVGTAVAVSCANQTASNSIDQKTGFIEKAKSTLNDVKDWSLQYKKN